jgi:iturin family lipopeptide synthetase A
VAPSTEPERLVAGIWQELFGIAELGVHDDFFELGGHSLLATQLLGRLLQRSPGAGLTLRTLFDHPTIAAQAARLEVSGDASSPTPDAPEADAPPPPLRAAVEESSLDALSDDEVTALLRRLTSEESSGS